MKVYNVDDRENSADAPEELRQVAHWAAWRRSGKHKVPVNPRTGKNASKTDPSTWGSFEEAASRAWRVKSLEGVGFVVSEDDPYTLIDVDNVFSEGGEVKDWAIQIVEEMDSYTELSPSGTGFRIVARGSKPGSSCKRKYWDGRVEMYDRGQFLTITGNVFYGSEIRDRQEKLDALYWKVWPEEKQPILRAPESHTNPSGGLGLVGTDRELIDKARKAEETGELFVKLFDHGNWSDFPSESEADLKLADLISFWTGPYPEWVERLMRSSALYREKWDSHRTYLKEITIEKVLKKRTYFYEADRMREQRRSVVESERERVRKELDPESTDARGLHLMHETAEMCGRYVDGEVEFNANQEQIAGEIGISQRGVSKMLKRLGAGGYTVKTEQGSKKKKRNSVYRIRKGGYGVGEGGSTTGTAEPSGSTTGLSIVEPKPVLPPGEPPPTDSPTEQHGGGEVSPTPDPPTVRTHNRTAAEGGGSTDREIRTIEVPFLDR